MASVTYTVRLSEDLLEGDRRANVTVRNYLHPYSSHNIVIVKQYCDGIFV